MDLRDIRNRIDEIDTALVDLLVKRMEITKEVADYKRKNGIPVLDRERELAVLEKRSQQAGDVYGPYIREIYEKIFEQSRAHQEKLLEG